MTALQSTVGQLFGSCSLFLYYSRTWNSSNGSHTVFYFRDKGGVLIWVTLGHRHKAVIFLSIQMAGPSPLPTARPNPFIVARRIVQDKTAPQHVVGSVEIYVGVKSRNWKLVEHHANHLVHRNQSLALDRSRVSTTRHLYTSPTAVTLLQAVSHRQPHVSTQALLVVNVGRNPAVLRLSNGICFSCKTFTSEHTNVHTARIPTSPSVRRYTGPFPTRCPRLPALHHERSLSPHTTCTQQLPA